MLFFLSTMSHDLPHCFPVSDAVQNCCYLPHCCAATYEQQSKDHWTSRISRPCHPPPPGDEDIETLCTAFHKNSSVSALYSSTAAVVSCSFSNFHIWQTSTNHQLQQPLSIRAMGYQELYSRVLLLQTSLSIVATLKDGFPRSLCYELGLTKLHVTIATQQQQVLILK